MDVVKFTYTVTRREHRDTFTMVLIRETQEQIAEMKRHVLAVADSPDAVSITTQPLDGIYAEVMAKRVLG